MAQMCVAAELVAEIGRQPGGTGEGCDVSRTLQEPAADYHVVVPTARWTQCCEEKVRNHLLQRIALVVYI